MSYFLNWTVVGIVVPLIIGVGASVMSMTPPDFRIAKACVTAAAVIFLIQVCSWLLTEQPSLLVRLLVIFLLFGLTGIGWLESWLWIAARQRVSIQVNSPPASRRSDGREAPPVTQETTESRAPAYTFSIFDVPSSISGSTVPQGINGRGEIVGYFTDVNGTHAFVSTRGAFTRIDYPGANTTMAQGINGNGEIVGSYADGRGTHGFLRQGADITTIDIEGSTATVAYGINDSRQIVGSFRDSSQITRGFLKVGSSVTLLDMPGTLATVPFRINNRQQIVGAYSDATGSHAFLYSNGVFKTVSIPGARAARGINDNGAIVGDLEVHGFLHIGDAFHRLDAPDAVPGSGGTGLWDINEHREIVGYVNTPTGMRAFVARPAGGR